MKKKSKIKGRKLSSKELKLAINEFFKTQSPQAFSARQVLKNLRIHNNKNHVYAAMVKLMDAGKLTLDKEGRFKAAAGESKNKKNSKPGSRQLQGIVDLTKQGSAFIVSEESEVDIYIPAKYVAGALNGDEVKIELTRTSRGRRPEGRVVKIVKRQKSAFAGVLRYFKNHSIVYVRDKRSRFDIIIPQGQEKEAEDFDKVMVEITDWPKSSRHSPKGRVILVLGEAGSSDAEMKGILVENGFELEFPKSVIDEANTLKEKASFAPEKGRKDLRDIPTFTIDPEDAKDFDDALSLRFLENDRFEIGVHIADVSHYVQKGSALDKEARNRGNSVYLVDRVLPMLPEVLSNELCSLRPDEEKNCFSVLFKFNKELELINYKITKTLIKSDKRFTYEEAQKRIQSGRGEFAKELRHLNTVAKNLRQKRFDNGSIGFESSEVKFKLDEWGRPVEILLKTRKDAHLLVEDFMLLANKCVAKYIHERGKSKEIPFPYRVHDLPDPAKMLDFSLLAQEMGIKLDLQTPKKIAESYNEITEKAKEDERLKILEPLAIRSMAKAEYTTDNIGHFGLGFEYYTHFTSPIRRYADLVVHRILHKNLKEAVRVDKEALESTCKHISTQERKAQEAERESVKYKQVEFMEDRIGETFIGVVTGFIERGFFVALEENLCEGMVSFSSFEESFTVSPLNVSAKGRQSGTEIKLGQEVKVKILDADLEQRRIEMEFV